MQEYIHGKQTLAQLAVRYQCSAKTIQRHIRQVAPPANTAQKVWAANLIMDTTYFGRNFGVMVFLDSLSGQVLYHQYVERETAALYQAGLRHILRQGISIQSITADGFKGLAKLLPDIPFQLCQFHQQQTIRRYLTRKPKSAAAKELKALADSLFRLSQADFTRQLQQWHSRYRDYLNEKSYGEEEGGHDGGYPQTPEACISQPEQRPAIPVYF
ncbi:hypothetical protein [Eikenella sp. Marseille-P7795]|uniref:IS256 family transposase, variant Zn-binding type n=1 Tax=Eikenella sp. Marseille-P7795 TaxID=2866577 RepID=UPI001CE45D39|nr:hypothetical protein [Eikenella sp. Marseille-P7795]